MRDYARRRSAIALAQDLIARANSPSPAETASDLIAEAIGGFDTLMDSATGATSMPAVPIATALATAVETVASAYQRDGQISGITWGLTELDRLTLGLHAGEVVIIGARPGMGKSALAVTCARAASSADHGVAISSLEMSADSLALRMLAEQVSRSGARIPYFAMRGGKIAESDFERITDAAKALGKLPIIIEEQPAVTIFQLNSKVRRCRKWLKRAGADLKLLIVDYMQLLTPGQRYAGSKVNEITEISAGLRRFSRGRRVLPCSHLSQLSRKVEEREDKRSSNLSDFAR